MNKIANILAINLLSFSYAINRKISFSVSSLLVLHLSYQIASIQAHIVSGAALHFIYFC